MQKWLAILWLSIGLPVFAQAQVLTPLSSQPTVNNILNHPAKAGSKANLLAEGDPLALPFLDDFSKAEGQPDPERWLNTGDVYVSDRFAKAPRTIFAAMFDGLRADGQPYSSSNSVGPTDTLTSRPLLLGNLQPQDSVYLSFYWQAGGFLDAPNFSSTNNFSLRLEFKDAGGNWTTVWNQRGSGRSTDFAPVMLALQESKYFHDAFQFRWLSSGAQYGLRDVWHLDYVFLDKNRRQGQLQTPDVALQKQLPSLLQRYTAMPFDQFMVNPEREVRAEIGSELINLSRGPAAVSWRGFVEQKGTGAVNTFLNGSGAISAGASRVFSAAAPLAFLQSQTEPFSVQTTVFLTTLEPNLRTRYNDTIRRQTDLLDYYAYDDGTAETGFSYPSSNAVQLAYQFSLNTPDQVKSVRVYFTANNTPGTVLYLRIWANDNGKPSAQALYEQQFLVPATLNDWFELELTTPVAVENIFYIGYRQPGGSAFVNVGFDFQENAMDKVFAANGSADWSTVTGFEGALLLRPVMAGSLLTSIPKSLEISLQLYPNPAVSYFSIGRPADAVELYSLTGQLLQTWSKPKKEEQFVLRKYPAGVYLVKIYVGTQLFTAKLILQP